MARASWRQSMEARWRTIYPALLIWRVVSAYPPALAASAPAVPGRPNTPRVFNSRAIAADNPRIHPEQDVAKKQLEVKADDVKLYRELGFTTVLATPAAGIFRGQSALLSLNSNDNPKNMVLATRVAQHMANELEPGGRGYPGSLMGVIAQVRQTFYDAQWYQRVSDTKLKLERPQINDSLEALRPVLAGRQNIIYATDNEQAYQRVAKIRDEFGLKGNLAGNGLEYRRNHLKASWHAIDRAFEFSERSRGRTSRHGIGYIPRSFATLGTSTVESRLC